MQYPELFWLTLTIMMTAFFWMPVGLTAIATRGLAGQLKGDLSDAKALPLWTQRANRALDNAGINLAIFAPLVLIATVVVSESSTVILASKIYFFARLIHFLVYTFGIFGLRTVAFVAGSVAQFMIAISILGAY